MISNCHEVRKQVFEFYLIVYALSLSLAYSKLMAQRRLCLFNKITKDLYMGTDGILTNDVILSVV